MSKGYCENVCNFDLNDYTCIGCGRTQAEVTEWFTASDERKKEIAKAARERAKQKKSQLK